MLEASQIKAHTPKYNILLKDDKGYSYIKVTRDEWPRLSFTLQKEDDGAEYIGPYTSSFAARQMAETAMDAFCCPGAAGGSRRKLAGAALPERPHRQVHGGVQRQG